MILKCCHRPGARLALNRGELTVFAHAESGEHLADHTRHVLWLGESLALDLSIF